MTCPTTMGGMDSNQATHVIWWVRSIYMITAQNTTADNISDALMTPWLLTILGNTYSINTIVEHGVSIMQIVNSYAYFKIIQMNGVCVFFNTHGAGGCPSACTR
jgi:hypothetical protein